VEFRLRNRSRLRRKEIEELSEQLDGLLGLAQRFGPEDPLEVAEGPDRRFLLLKHEIVGFWDGDRPFLTPRGLLKWPAAKRYVTVDMGAVRFVTNGADTMGPGIVDADADIHADDLVWVREERHKKPLAVGVALSDASVLRSKAKGKQVRALYYVGDKVWTFGQEEPARPAEDA
jgi:PUA-domain protein